LWITITPYVYMGHYGFLYLFATETLRVGDTCILTKTINV
jgi:hypothetical protein